MLGGRIAAWIGAILVMIGIGVFLKYAYDRDWLANLGPMGRFVGSTALALALVGLGELALRQWGRAAAAGLFCAGLGSLFVIAAAGTQPEFMQVFGPEGSLVYALGATVLGVLVARRSQLLAVGVVVMIGAYLVPLFTGVLRIDGSFWPQAYLTAVLIAALSLAHFVPSQAAVRVVALGLHLTLAFLLLAGRSMAPATAQLFVVIWWALFMLESVGSVLRMEARGPSSSDLPQEDRAGTIECAVVVVATLAAIGASFAFAGAWAGLRDPWAWMPLGQGVLCLAAAVQLGTMRSENASPALVRMIATLAAVGGGAVLASMALLLDRRGASVAWAIMGTAAIVAASRLRSRGLLLAAVAALAAATATAAWIALTARAAGVGLEFHSLPGLAATRICTARDWWMPLGVAIATIASSRLLARLDWAVGFRVVCAVLATLAFAAFSIAIGVDGSALLVAAALPAWWLLAPAPQGDRFERSAGTALATVLACVCLLAALAQLGVGGGDATAGALSILIAGGLMGLGAAQGDEGSRSTLAISGAVLIGAVGVFELAGGRATGDAAQRAMGAMGEVSTVAALAAILSIVMRFTGRRSTAIGTGMALWSALAWMYASVVFGAIGGLGSAPPMSNLTNATAALVIASLGTWMGAAKSACACAVALVVLVAGTMDLERLARTMGLPRGDEATLRQALRSIWWAAVATGGVISGFVWRITPLRWLSLAILAITAIKVLLIDLQHAATLARVGALIAVGMLLVGVSVVYARAERRLRAPAEGAAAGGSTAR